MDVAFFAIGKQANSTSLVPYIVKVAPVFDHEKKLFDRCARTFWSRHVGNVMRFQDRAHC